jgi:hypothetical protein
MHGTVKPTVVVLRQTGSARDREALSFLKVDKELNVLEMPNNALIMTNFDAGKPWWTGLRKQQRETIRTLLSQILIVKNII